MRRGSIARLALLAAASVGLIGAVFAPGQALPTPWQLKADDVTHGSVTLYLLRTDPRLARPPAPEPDDGEDRIVVGLPARGISPTIGADCALDPAQRRAALTALQHARALPASARPDALPWGPRVNFTMRQGPGIQYIVMVTGLPVTEGPHRGGTTILVLEGQTYATISAADWAVIRKLFDTADCGGVSGA